jgi:hypothetical protein
MFEFATNFDLAQSDDVADVTVVVKMRGSVWPYTIQTHFFLHVEESVFFRKPSSGTRCARMHLAFISEQSRYDRRFSAKCSVRLNGARTCIAVPLCPRVVHRATFRPVTLCGLHNSEGSATIGVDRGSPLLQNFVHLPL